MRNLEEKPIDLTVRKNICLHISNSFTFLYIDYFCKKETVVQWEIVRQYICDALYMYVQYSWICFVAFVELSDRFLTPRNIYSTTWDMDFYREFHCTKELIILTCGHFQVRLVCHNKASQLGSGFCSCYL